MTKHFYPRKTSFWLTHLFGILIFDMSYELFGWVTTGVFTFDIEHKLATLDFYLFLTHAGLLYRYLLLSKYKCDRFSIRMVIFTLFYCLLVSFIYTHIGFYWLNNLLPATLGIDVLQLGNSDFSAPELGEHYVGNQTIVQIFLFTHMLTLVSVWTILYYSYLCSYKLQQRKIETLKLENEFKDLQLLFLNENINPHFLFNALNNIYFMVDINQESAKLMISNLSDALRSLTKLNNNKTVTLSDEINFIKNLLHIYKIQYGDKLNYSFYLDDTVSDNKDLIRLPPLSLQILFENAIKHGIDVLLEGGLINTSLFVKDDFFVIEVTNDAPNEANITSSSTKMGLSNLGKRVELLYGSKARLETIRKESTFIARLKLPYGRESGENSYH